MDEDKSLQIYQERVIRVEEKVQYIAVEQTQMRGILEKQTAILDGIANKINASDLNAVAIKERTDQHSRTIEHLQESEADVSKILESMKTQLNLIKYIGGAVASLIIGYLFSHFVH